MAESLFSDPKDVAEKFREDLRTIPGNKKYDSMWDWDKAHLSLPNARVPGVVVPGVDGMSDLLIAHDSSDVERCFDANHFVIADSVEMKSLEDANNEMQIGSIGPNFKPKLQSILAKYFPPLERVPGDGVSNRKIVWESQLVHQLAHANHSSELGALSDQIGYLIEQGFKDPGGDFPVSNSVAYYLGPIAISYGPFAYGMALAEISGENLNNRLAYWLPGGVGTRTMFDPLLTEIDAALSDQRLDSAERDELLSMKSHIAQFLNPSSETNCMKEVASGFSWQVISRKNNFSAEPQGSLFFFYRRLFRGFVDQDKMYRFIKFVFNPIEESDDQ